MRALDRGWRSRLAAWLRAWAQYVEGPHAEEPAAGDDVRDALAALFSPISDKTRQRLRALLAQTPAPPERTLRDLRISSIDDLEFCKNSILHLPDIRLPDSIRYGFIEIPDAIVTPFGFVVSGDSLIFNTQILPGGWMRGGDGGAPDLATKILNLNSIHRLDIWRETCRLSLPAEIDEIAGPAFLFNSRLTCFNFAHFVHDTLIQTPTYRDCVAHLGEAVTPMLVGPGFPYPAMADIFARAVGPSPPPFFLRGRFYRAPRLYVPTTHYRPASQAIARGAVARLMQTLSAALADQRGPARRRIFISRDDSGRGGDREPRFANAPALAQALAALGVETVVVSRLSPEDYLKTFVNAELIVGLHGAGLTNVVLADAPRIVEITVPGYPDWRSLMLFIETGMGAPFRRVVMPPPENGVATYDIAAIVAACEAVLATPCPARRAPL